VSVSGGKQEQFGDEASVLVDGMRGFTVCG